MNGPMLIGRILELECLEKCLQKMVNSTPCLLFISGEAGIGKTRLIDAFLDRAKSSYPELVSAVGHCNAQLGQADSMLPFRTIIDQLVKRIKADRSGKFNPKIKNLLRNIGPDIIGLIHPIIGIAFKAPFAISDIFSRKKSSATGHTSDIAPYDLQSGTDIFARFRHFFLQLSRKIPLLLILEDLHWADESTIEFIFQLARSWEDHQLMIVGTYRPDEIKACRPAHPLLNNIRELLRYRLCEQYRLGWLSKQDVHEWLHCSYPNHQLSETFVRWLHRRTKGNAFFIEELLRYFQDCNLLYQDDAGVWLLSQEIWNKKDLPPTIIAVIEQRLRRLGQTVLDILSCASVEGVKFTSQIVAMVCRLDHDETIDTLINVLDRQYGLVVLRQERCNSRKQTIYRFEFRHVLIQSYLYNQLKSPQKRRLHRCVGECLEMLYGTEDETTAPELARHFKLAQDMQKTFKYVLAAANSAEAIQNYRAARQWFKQSVEFFTILPIPAQLKGDIFYRLGRAEMVAGSFEESKNCFTQAMNIVKTFDDRQRQADILFDLGFCYIKTAQARLAVPILTKALALNHDTGRTLQAAYVQVRLAFAYHSDGRQYKAKALLLNSKKQFDQLNETNGTALVCHHLGINYSLEKNFDQSARYLIKAIRFDKKSGNVSQEASDYTNLGSLYLNLKDDCHRAMRCYLRAYNLSHQIGKRYEQAHLLLNMARLYGLAKDWRKARCHVEKGLGLAKKVNGTTNIIRGHWYRGIVNFYQNRICEAICDYAKILDSDQQGARNYWAIRYNLATLQQKNSDIEAAFKTCYEAGHFLLDLVASFSKQEKTAYWKTDQSIHIFRALYALANQTRRLHEIQDVLDRLPSELVLETGKPLPFFYWGGDKWG